MKKGCVPGIIFLLLVTFIFLAPWRTCVTYGYEIIRIKQEWGEMGTRLLEDHMGKEDFFTTTYGSPYELLFWIEVPDAETQGTVIIDRLELKNTSRDEMVFQIKQPTETEFKMGQSPDGLYSGTFFELGKLKLENYDDYGLAVYYRINTDTLSLKGSFEQIFNKDFNKHRSNNFIKGCMSI